MSLPRSDAKPGNAIIYPGGTNPPSLIPLPSAAPVLLDQAQEILRNRLIGHIIEQLVQAILQPDIKRRLEVLRPWRMGTDYIVLPLLHG